MNIKYISILLILIVLSVNGIIIAQDIPSQSESQLNNLSDAKNNNGYKTSSVLALSGKIAVSPASGNINYVYNLASYSKSGYPINISLNYVGSVGFTAFETATTVSDQSTCSPCFVDYPRDHFGNIRPWDMGPEDVPQEYWSQFNVNKPLWLLSINGFAVQAFSQATEMVMSPNARRPVPGFISKIGFCAVPIPKNSSGVPESATTYTNPANWGNDEFVPQQYLIEGYDYCNRMSMKAYERTHESISVNNTADIIKLLRADGGVLELVNVNPRTTLFSFDDLYNEPERYSGKYVEKGANAKGYAYVEFDETLVPASLETDSWYGDLLYGAYGNWKHVSEFTHFKPRKVHYYPGDGLEYIFVEHIAPYGNDYYTGKIVIQTAPCLSKSLWGGPAAGATIFYLVDIRSDNRSLMKFGYESHVNIRAPDNKAVINTDKRGRARLTRLGEHSIQYAADAGHCTIQIFDKDFQLLLEKPFSNTRIDNSYFGHSGTPSEAYNIIQIKDPEGRTISFDYEKNERRYDDYAWLRFNPVGCNAKLSGHVYDPTVVLQYSRLKTITEPMSYTLIDYYQGYRKQQGTSQISCKSFDNKYNHIANNNTVPEHSMRNVFNTRDMVKKIENRIAPNKAITTEDLYEYDGTSTNTQYCDLKQKGYGLTSLGQDNASYPYTTTIQQKIYPNIHITDANSSLNGITTSVQTITKKITFALRYWEFKDHQSKSMGQLRFSDATPIIESELKDGIEYITKTDYGVVTTSMTANLNPSNGVGTCDDGLYNLLPDVSSDFIGTHALTQEKLYWSFNNTPNTPTVLNLRLPINKKTWIKRNPNNTPTLVSYRSYQYKLAKVRDFPYSSTSDAKYLQHQYFGYGIERQVEKIHNPEDTLEVLYHNDQTYLTLPEQFTTSQTTRDIYSLSYWPLYTRSNENVEQNGTNKPPLIESRHNFSKLPDNASQLTQSLTLPNNTMRFPYSVNLPLKTIITLPDYCTILLGERFVYQQTYDPNVYLDRNTLLKKFFIGKSGVETETERFSYQNNKIRSLVDKITGVHGSYVRQQYYLDDVPSQWGGLRQNFGGYDHFYGKVYKNDWSDASIENKPMRSVIWDSERNGLSTVWTIDREEPYVQTSRIRYYKDGNTNSLDSMFLTTLYERNSLGQIVGTADANSWYHQNEYDNLGRPIFVREPGDFPKQLKSWRLNKKYTGISQSHWQYKVCVKTTPPGSTLTEEYDDVESGDGVIARPLDDGPSNNRCDDVFVRSNSGGVKVTEGHLYAHKRFYETMFTFTKNYTTLHGASMRFHIASADKCFPVRIKTYSGTTELVSRTLLLNCGQIDANSNNNKWETTLSGVPRQGVVKGEQTLESLYSTFWTIPLNATELAAINNQGNDVALKVIIEPANLNKSKDRCVISGKSSDLAPAIILDCSGTSELSLDDYTEKYVYKDATQYTLPYEIEHRQKVDDIIKTYSDYANTSTLDDDVRRKYSQYRLISPNIVRTAREGTTATNNATEYPSGTTEQFSLTDGAGRTVLAKDQENYQRKNQYDQHGRPILTVQPDGSEIVYTYSIGTPTELGLNGIGISVDFDGFCTIVSQNTVKTVGGISTISPVRRQYYDVYGRVCVEELEEGNTKLRTQYFYDVQNRTIEVINPKGQITRYWYDDYGRVKYKYNSDLGVVSYAYDKAGNTRFSQTQRQADSSKITFYEYDDLHRMTVSGEARIAEAIPALTYTPSVTRETSISLNRLTDDPSINPDVLQDNGQSEILTANVTLLSPSWYAVPFTVWSMTTVPTDGNLPCIDEERGRTAPYLSCVTSENFIGVLKGRTSNKNDFEDLGLRSFNMRTVTLYDRLPKMPRVQAGAAFLHSPFQTTWDKLAPKGSYRNLKGKVAAVAYREHEQSPMNYVQYSYDERGRVEAQVRYTDNLGWDAVYYEYNSMNLPIRVMVADAYRNHTTWYSYDHKGRLNKVWSKLGASASGLATLDPGTQAILDWNYPAVPTLTTTMRTTNLEVQQAYNPRNLVSQISYPQPGITTNYTYNNKALLSTAISKKGPTELFRQELQYNFYDLVSKHKWNHADLISHEIDAVYDVYRLKEWEYAIAGIDQKKETYAYDDVGNRLSAINNIYLPLPRTETSTAGIGLNNNELLNYHTVAGLTPLTERYHNYDANGSLDRRLIKTASIGTFTNYKYEYEDFDYTYNGLVKEYARMEMNSPNGSLVCMNTPIDNTIGSFWRYRYSSGGEREQKRLTVHPSMNNTLNWTYYLLGTDNRQYAMYEGRHNRTLVNNNRTVVWSPSEYLMYGSGSNSLISFLPTGAKEYRIIDHLGSTRCILNNTGTVINTMNYEPFGKQMQTGDVPRQGYIGKELDGESDLADHGVRKYDYITGRFMAVDPLWEKYRGLSPYHYGANNPLKILDPNGLQGIVNGTASERTDVLSNVNTRLNANFTYDANVPGLIVADPNFVPSNDEGRNFLNMVQDQNITVNINVTNDTHFFDFDPTTMLFSDPLVLVNGRFEGSTVDGSGHVTAKQYINLNHMSTIEQTLQQPGSKAESVVHEILEGYVGAVQNPGGTYATAFQSAHNSVLRMMGSTTHFVPFDGADHRNGVHYYGYGIQGTTDGVVLVFYNLQTKIFSQNNNPRKITNPTSF